VVGAAQEQVMALGIDRQQIPSARVVQFISRANGKGMIEIRGNVGTCRDSENDAEEKDLHKSTHVARSSLSE
jgi:hypothetical protein